MTYLLQSIAKKDSYYEKQIYENLKLPMKWKLLR